MKKLNKNQLSKFLVSNWIITLSATMLGVFIGVYVNDWMASNKIAQQKDLAINNILTELSDNNKNLKTVVKEHINIYETLDFMSEHLDDKKKLIASSNEMQEFRLKHPKFINITDSIALEDGRYKYSGEINVDFGLPQLNITDISWNTVKNSGLSAHFDFSCLKYLESINKMEKEISEKNTELLDYFIGKKDAGDKNQILMNHLKFLIEFEETLINGYEQSEAELKK